MMAANGQWRIQWVDNHSEPECPANPDYPHGVDIDATTGECDKPSCSTLLPYPARRCGYYLVQCLRCGLQIAVTTAGRDDDPRSVRVLCKGLST